MKIYQVDAFARKVFQGNPAAVCILSEGQEESWMRDVAREMNLSETAFLLEHDDGFNLRWFTPEAEVDLCGHATLASAHILWETGRLTPDQEARFYTKSGLLSARRVEPNRIELNFPAKPVTPTEPPSALLDALGLESEPVYVGRSSFDYLLELGSEKQVRSLRPDFTRLRSHPVRGIIVTSRASSAPYDIISRFFAPAVGVDEDPVTGSAHCSLGPYWQDKLGKQSLMAWQASARGGEMEVRTRGDRVYLLGHAITVFIAEWLGY